MNLVKEVWKEKDKKEFQKYLISLQNNEKKEWAKNILNTNMNVLAIKSSVIKDIANNISKGNYISFLDLMIWEYYENTAINAFLISKIKDFNTLRKYLNIYSKDVDNWASCDVLSFDIKGNEDKFLELSKEYIKSDKPFIRRIGIVILFNFVNYNEYLDEIFNILNGFYNEEHYYVNMVNSWLLCECFIKHRNETIKFLKTHKLNKFTINKAIQKCRDSYRVSIEDKEMLLKYKVK